MDLIVATRNRGKAREFAEMLDLPGVSVRGLAEVDCDLEPEETGRSFHENACLKARAYARATGSWVLADDSGLSVDALGGRPGVYSAYFAKMNGAGEGDADNNAYLLRRLEKVADAERTARFECVLAVADPLGRVALTARGEVEGVVLRQPRGENGFGYDPLYLHPPSGKTTAEMTPAEKHAISHRGRALARLRELMAKHL